MIETSDFILPKSAVTGKASFEKITPLETEGATSSAFVVRVDGKQFFMKKLKSQYASAPIYRNIFVKEYETGVSVSHPNVVRYEKLVMDADGPYILMEYVNGCTLDRKVEQDPEYFKDRYNLDKLLIQLLEGLNCLHANHILHCDIKPQNIMLSQVNNDVKIIDLGFCYTDKYDYTAGHTNEFSSPEQQISSTAQLAVSTDIYGVGTILKYLQHSAGVKLPKVYRTIMERCLQEDSKKRYRDTEEILGLLKRERHSRKITIGLVATIVLALCFWRGYVLREQVPEAASLSEDGRRGMFADVEYTITSDAEATCSVIGGESVADVVIEKQIKINGETYTVTQVSDSAFYRHERLTSVLMPDGMTGIGKNAFASCPNLQSVTFPSGITEIPIGCLHHSPVLKKVHIPEGVKRVGADAFACCTALEEVVLPSGLESIGAAAFYECRSMKEITIPATVHTIESFAFFGCENLTHVYNHSPKPQQIFRLFNTGNIVVHVPKGSETLYAEDENWRQYQVIGDLNTTSSPS
ncbi:MAG: leucine-rich repeat protein [Bacteroidaceae bacterium]|nr:leucine-rich repeat protein [Bacteroidaceae bacterium]